MLPAHQQPLSNYRGALVEVLAIPGLLEERVCARCLVCVGGGRQLLPSVGRLVPYSTEQYSTRMDCYLEVLPGRRQQGVCCGCAGVLVPQLPRRS